MHRVGLAPGIYRRECRVLEGLEVSECSGTREYRRTSARSNMLSPLLMRFGVSITRGDPPTQIWKVWANTAAVHRGLTCSTRRPDPLGEGRRLIVKYCTRRNGV
jgi:hypothetical protein